MSSSAPEHRPQDPNLRLLNGEMWLARRLSRWGLLVGTFEGVTDPAERKKRLRESITSRGLEAVYCDIDRKGEPGRRTLTYQQAFERLYGEKL